MDEAKAGEVIKQITIAVAVRVANERWTEADTKTYGPFFYDKIARWAQEMGEFPTNILRQKT